jgi:hypothetical protein
MVAAATRLSLRTRRWTAHLFAVIFLLLMLLTSLYRDVEYAYLKRTDFLPVLLAFFIMAWLGPAARLTRGRKLLAAGLGLLVLWQVATGWRWRSREVASYETLDMTVLGRRVPGYHGLPPEGSFLRHFRSLRKGNPKACAFVFDAGEVQHGRWNPDLTGSIWSELPKHLVLAGPGQMGGWPRPLDTIDPGQAKKTLTGCEWLSEAARRRLGMPAP